MAKSTDDKRAQLRQRQAEAEKQRKRRSKAIVIGAAVAVIVVVIVTSIAVFQNMSKNNDPKYSGDQIKPPNASDNAIVMAADNPKPDALDVYLFLDYQCPGCRILEHDLSPALNKLVKDGDIKLHARTMLFMEIPEKLNNTASSRAAIAAACADTVGKFRPYHEQVFANQEQEEVRGSEGYSDDLLRNQLPKKVGITGEKLTKFQACYDERKTEKFVNDVNEAAENFKHTNLKGTEVPRIVSTPTVVVGGKQVNFEKLQGADAESLLKLFKETA